MPRVSAEQNPRPLGGALILAAGFGRRFGSDKRAYQLPDGRSLLEATVERYAEAYADLCVVLRPEDESLARRIRALPGNPEIALSPDAELGMGHSLAAGVRTIADHWQWASVGLGDMPFIATATLRELLDVFFSNGAESIVQPVHEGRPGHPVTFPGSCFAAMCRLEGDQGARAIVETAEQVIRHPVADKGVLDDVDTPAAAENQ